MNDHTSMKRSLQQSPRRKFNCIPEVNKYSIWVMSHVFPFAFQEDLETRSGLRICESWYLKFDYEGQVQARTDK